MSDAKMKMATMTSSTSYPVWLRWHRIAGFQKLASQEKHNDNCQKDVNRGEDNERHDQSRHGRYRFASPHHAINYPWLASQFRYHPSGFIARNPNGPAATRPRKSHLLSGKRRYFSHNTSAESVSARISMPEPTMMSKDQCTSRTFGHWSRGNSSRPITFAFGLCAVRRLKPRGISTA